MGKGGRGGPEAAARPRGRPARGARPQGAAGAIGSAGTFPHSEEAPDGREAPPLFDDVVEDRSTPVLEGAEGPGRGGRRVRGRPGTGAPGPARRSREAQRAE